MSEQDAAPPPRRFTGRKAAAAEKDGPESKALQVNTVQPAAAAAGGGPKRFVRQQVPPEITDDPDLKSAMSVLPTNYNFEVRIPHEIHKSVWRIKQAGAKKVALQFPEGLLMYSCAIADILEAFAGVEECLILGDVTYGACCIDDFAAAALGADFLVHYGHSCLVPVDVTHVPCMYVFVDIGINVEHLVATVRHNFPPGTDLVLAGTIQFATSIQAARRELAEDYPSLTVPQAKPLSPGEVLGCTAPVVGKGDAILFVADGRFHLEALMIANPTIKAYRYDPYNRVLTEESYDHEGMRAVRRNMIERAMAASSFGVVLGTLGRQGSPYILRHVEERLKEKGLPYHVVLLSELTPAKLEMMQGPDAWIQIACPRLSIDWGEGFTKPTLTPYEAEVALGGVRPWWVEEEEEGGGGGEGGEGVAAPKDYPMDYYDKTGGPWSSSYQQPSRRKGPVPEAVAALACAKPGCCKAGGGGGAAGGRVSC